MARASRTMKINEWERLLQAKCWADRLEAVENPPKGNASRVVRGLIRALERDPHATVRTYAADLLTQVPMCDAARAALRRRCKREREYLARAYAMSSLGRVGDLSDAVYLLGAVRRARNDLVRVHAVAGALWTVRRVAKEQLRRGLRARHPGVRGSSASVLCDMVLSSFDDGPEVIDLLKSAVSVENKRLIEGQLRDAIKTLERHTVGDPGNATKRKTKRARAEGNKRIKRPRRSPAAVGEDS